MKLRLCNLFCITALWLNAAGPSRAQNLEVKAPSDLSSRNREAIEVSRDQVRTDRKALVEKAMRLTDNEAQAFWPVYDEYTGELGRISDRTVSLVTEFADNYKDLADSEAMRMTSDSLSIEQQRLAVRSCRTATLTASRFFS